MAGKLKFRLLGMIVFLSINLFGNYCLANTDEETASRVDNADPLSGYNHAMYRFNDKFDRFLLKPIAKVYKGILPARVVKCINNFYFNLSEIPTVINDLLQLNFYQTTSDTWRFAINSTLGIGGLFDIASNMGLEKKANDVGLTFAKWGYKKSRYFVLPLLGPSTIRDTLAFPFNYGLTVYPYIRPMWAGYTLVGVDWIDQRAQLLDFEDVRKQAALDPYEFERNAYLQKRNSDIEANDKSPARKIVTTYTATK